LSDEAVEAGICAETRAAFGILIPTVHPQSKSLPKKMSLRLRLWFNASPQKILRCSRRCGNRPARLQCVFFKSYRIGAARRQDGLRLLRNRMRCSASMRILASRKESIAGLWRSASRAGSATVSARGRGLIRSHRHAAHGLANANPLPGCVLPLARCPPPQNTF
jgi:hypothetical protein